MLTRLTIVGRRGGAGVGRGTLGTPHGRTRTGVAWVTPISAVSACIIATRLTSGGAGLVLMVTLRALTRVHYSKLKDR
jgi:hypothetical protein